jgi:hypothetical protein
VRSVPERSPREELGLPIDEIGGGGGKLSVGCARGCGDCTRRREVDGEPDGGVALRLPLSIVSCSSLIIASSAAHCGHLANPFSISKSQRYQK